MSVPPPAPPSGAPMWLCWLCLIGQDAHCRVLYPVKAQWSVHFLFALRKMSSLYKPFSVSDGPCKDAIWRRGCKSVQHPAALSSAPSPLPPPAGLCVIARSFTPIHNVCEGKRRFAAAATSGRKITHPGKAILAGKCLSRCRFLFLQTGCCVGR